jgi:predicted nucleotidyltransferase
MNVFIEEHRQMLLALIKHKVNFMLVGGYAVIHYGYGRSTGDMDIWLQLGNDNKNRVLTALAEFGIEEDDISQLREINLDAAVPVFYIGEEPRRIDFVTALSRVAFEDAVKNATHFPLEGELIPVIHYNDLILSKMHTGRVKDKADIEELQRINKYRTDS